MFIRVTYNNEIMYINVAHIEGFRPYKDYTQVWLSDGEMILVEETINQVLNLIKEARKNGN